MFYDFIVVAEWKFISNNKHNKQ